MPTISSKRSTTPTNPPRKTEKVIVAATRAKSVPSAAKNLSSTLSTSSLLGSRNITTPRASNHTVVGGYRYNQDENEYAIQMTCERVLNDQQVRLMALLLRAKAAHTSHDMAAVKQHANTRAREAVEEELSRILANLIQLQGISPLHRATARSQLSTQLTYDIENAIFTDDKANIFSLKTEQRLRHEEYTRAKASLAHEMAAKDLAIASLHSDKADLDLANQSLMRNNNALQKELENSLHNQSAMHQQAVELRMQGLDFKAKVDSRCIRVMSSIQSRMGFIPAGVQKQILGLRILKVRGSVQTDTHEIN